MFCLKCGEVIPDGSVTCPICGKNINEVDENDKTIVYASYGRSEEVSQEVEVKQIKTKMPYIVLIILAVLSFLFLNLNYMSISIDLYFGGSSDSVYSGYFLTECLDGTASLSGMMVIMLIILNISTIITAVLGCKDNIIKDNLMRMIILLESIIYVVVTIIPFFHLSSLLKEFDNSITTTSIGSGCYLNILVALVVVVVRFKYFSSKIQ